MWLVSCRTWGMLIQGPPPDLKCRYNIIPYTSTPVTLPHLCQEYHDHCIVISGNGGMERLGGGGSSFMLGFGWGDSG